VPTFVSGLLLIYVFYYLLGLAPDPTGRIDASTNSAMVSAGSTSCAAALRQPSPSPTRAKSTRSLDAGGARLGLHPHRPLAGPAAAPGGRHLCPAQRDPAGDAGERRQYEQRHGQRRQHELRGGIAPALPIADECRGCC
jgi:hypothetical protein